MRAPFDGLYVGMIGGPTSPGGSAQETLTVSPSGREVASVVVLPAECGQPGGPLATVRNVKIVNGSFTAAYPRTPTASGVFNDATLTGHFLAHGRVTGREDVRSNETINGSLCKYSLPWTATAQPTGTKRCPNHTHGTRAFSDILVSHDVHRRRYGSGQRDVHPAWRTYVHADLYHAGMGVSHPDQRRQQPSVQPSPPESDVQFQHRDLGPANP
ncbi:MAG: hypothetical protein M3071_02545 [Actinomycetota bacterium]|nr:hypothetical protein [Actinomycetota bacterium]